jgi:hypothetical protein
MANSPEHYGSNWEVGDFIVDQKLSFFLANAVKYICRCEHKGDKKKDITKAIHYLQHELDKAQSDWDDTIRPSGAVPSSLLFSCDWDEWTTDPEMFDR